MKRKLQLKLAALLLSAVMAANAVPVFAQNGTDDGENEKVLAEEYSEFGQEELSVEGYEESMQEEPSDLHKKEGDEIYFGAGEAHIQDLDYKAASDQELDECLLLSDDREVAMWLSSFTEEEKDGLLKRDTCLNQSLDYYGDGCPECGYTWGSHFDTAREYYELLADCHHGLSAEKATYYFTSTSGYIEIAFAGLTAEPVVSKLKVAGVDTGKATSYQQEKLSCSIINAKYGLSLVIPDDKTWSTWAAGSKLSDVESYLDKGKKNGPHGINYHDIVPNVYFTKPAGYALSSPVYTNYSEVLHTFYTGYEKKTYTYNGKTYSGVCYLSNALGADNDYAQEKKISFHASSNLIRNYGIGARNSAGEVTTQPGNHERATFTLTPARYSMTYDVNGGSGSVAAQSCIYGESYAYPASPTPPVYTITYNGNGGTANQSSATVPRKFLGWNQNRNATSGYTGIYKADHTQNQAVLTNYALWGAAESAVVLPSAQRAGYKMQGWFASPSGGTLAGNALGSYKPSGNVTLYARWEPIQYEILYDADGGVLDQKLLDADGKVKPQKVLYGQEVTLPVPKKTGYLFKGWQSDTAVYPETESSVKNLTEKEGVQILLTALWEAQKVPYTIRNFFKKPGEKEYVLNEEETEICEAVADSLLTVFPKHQSGYITPSSQTVEIRPDGSTVVDFYYDCNLVDDSPQAEGNGEILNDILLRLKEIESVNELTKQDWEKAVLLIAAAMDSDQATARKLEEVIKDTKNLTEKEKIELLESLASGYLTDSLREKLVQAVKQSSLSQKEKDMLIQKLLSISNLSLAQQQELKEKLEKGSSVSYKIDGVSYTIRKNPNGTLSILLSGTNGQKKVTIPDAVTVAGKTYAVTEIAAGAFKKDAAIEEVVIGNNIASIGKEAFSGCASLKKVTLSATVRDIGDSAFAGCKKLTLVSLNEGLLQIGKKAFYECTSLGKIKIPKSVLLIKKYAFAKCSKLKTVTFAAGSMLVSAQEGAFSECVLLEKIKLPSKLTIVAKKLFYEDKKLKSCQCQTAVTSIGESALEGCKKLISFTIGAKVQTIKKKAFYRCSSLKTVKIRSQVLTKVGKSAFKKCRKGIRFQVPAKKKTAYAKLFKGKY